MVRHRFFAAIYDSLMSSTEEAGLAEERGRLLAEARGRTLELGAGTGLNLGHYPEAVTGLVLAEPDPHMAKRLRRRLAENGSGPGPEVVEAGAERLPFEDDSFDTVVSTLVLCSVEDPGRSLAEVRRVLRPGGRLLYLEHVRAEGERLGRWQDRLERPWARFAGGCHCNRDTAAALRAAGFDLADQRSGEMPKSPPIVRPLISGATGVRG